MITVTKEFRWEMAHILENHDGLCANVHGHNYRMLVEVQRKRGKREVLTKSGNPKEGMVVDFKELFLYVNETVIEFFDHSFCYNENDKNNTSIAKVLEGQIQQKLAPFPYRVTAENIAKFCYEKLDNVFTHRNLDIKIVSVTIYENDFSSAKYTFG